MKMNGDARQAEAAACALPRYCENRRKAGTLAISRAHKNPAQESGVVRGPLATALERSSTRYDRVILVCPSVLPQNQHRVPKTKVTMQLTVL